MIAADLRESHMERIAGWISDKPTRLVFAPSGRYDGLSDSLQPSS